MPGGVGGGSRKASPYPDLKGRWSGDHRGEAWIAGVSTRKVDDLVQAMGLSGISKSQVSKLCKEIDERVGAFLKRSLEGDWPYLWLDATYLKVREGGRIVSVAAIIAVAANTDGRREIIGLHIGPSEAETFWSSFLKDLVRRGLKGVKLVISDSHEGLKGAIQRVIGATPPGPAGPVSFRDRMNGLLAIHG